MRTMNVSTPVYIILTAFLNSLKWKIAILIAFAFEYNIYFAFINGCVGETLMVFKFYK